MILALLLALPAPALELVSIDSPSALLTVRVMVRAGSAQDPAGREGLAQLTGRMLLEGGFGDPAAPVTKERLAELTRRWGGAALPEVRAGKETTVFAMTVPREALAEYAGTVLGPLLTRPVFAQAEFERLRADALEGLRSLRLEEIEASGLQALEDWLHQGTPYAHPDAGTERGLRALERADAAAFYRRWYRAGNVIVGTSSSDPAVAETLRRALAGLPSGGAPAREPRGLRASSEAQAVVVAVPGARSTGLHAGFPLSVRRGHPDYWPLYVANVWLGAHRDSFSRLYQLLREERGYNYGDYSYIESFEGRPYNLFMPFNAPRRLQVLSLWARPVAHEHAAHLARALDFEFAEFARGTLSEEQCELSRRKARVIYLSLAESTDRLVEARLDDAFLGLAPGWLESYLEGIESASCARINEAARRHLAGRKPRWLAVTEAGRAAALAAELSSEEPAWGKGPADYQIDVSVKDGRAVYEVPEERLRTLRRDAVWAHRRLGLSPERVRVVPAERLFAKPGLTE